MHFRFSYIIGLLLVASNATFLWANPPDWVVDAEDFQYSASINAQIMLDGITTDNAGDVIGLFVGEELRGVSTAVELGEEIYHFITVYANISSGEEMEIRVYHAQDDQIYVAYNTYSFSLLDISGSFIKPFQILVQRDGDFPIAITNSIPPQSTLQGIPFDGLDLAPYLEQLDDDGVVWVVASNPYLSAVFNGSVLQVTPLLSDFTGTTLLTVVAIEDGLNQFSAQALIQYEVKPAYLGPAWDIFLGESVAPGEFFSNFLLDDFEMQYEGECLQYDLIPLFDEDPPITAPQWEAIPSSTSNSMPVVAQTAFTPDFVFQHPDDQLGAFYNGSTVGAASPVLIGEKAMYFLQIYAEIPDIPIELRFYSAALRKIFTLPYTLPYNGIAGYGSIDAPILLDFSPFVFDIGEDSQTTVTAQNPDWQGAQTYLFTAADCTYPEALSDETTVTYCIGPDTDEDGFCNTIDEAPLDPCIPDYYPPELRLYDENGQTLVSSESVLHTNDFNDCAKALTWRIIATEDCDIPVFDVQIINEEIAASPFTNVALQDAEQGIFRFEVYAAVGTNRIQLRATDSDGNTAYFDYTVVVEDIQAPNLVCQSTQVLLDPQGQGVLLPAQTQNPISRDNCGIESLSVDVDHFSCSDLGNQMVTLFARDAAGNESSCTATVSVAPSGDLPQNWSTTDIGQVTAGNDFSFDPCTAPSPEDGEFMIVGSGNNATSSTTDNVAYAGYSICGNGSVTAKLESISSNGYGGLMIRESNMPGAKQVAVFSNLTSILRHEARYTNNSPKQISSFFKPSPFWLRLERQGSWIFAYYSTTGYNFQYVHGVFVPMQDCIEIGLASFTFFPGQQTEAIFSNVSVQGTNGWGSDQIIEGLGNGNTIIEKESAKHFIYPNPAGEHVYLTVDQTEERIDEIQLFNAMGQLIEKRSSRELEIQTEWSLGGLSEGLYFFRLVKKGRGEEIIRFVKTR